MLELRQFNDIVLFLDWWGFHQQMIGTIISLAPTPKIYKDKVSHREPSMGTSKVKIYL